MTTSSHTALNAKVLACLFFATIAATPSASAESAAAVVAKKKLEWRSDLPAALADAAKQNKTVLLRFTATWCGPCRVMDARVWTDPTVQAELSAKHIIVKSDIDDEASQLLAQKYGVRGVPTLLLLDSAGKETGRGGFMSSPETVKFLKSAGAKTALP
jgi:thiol:disulfide interchange protein